MQDSQELIRDLIEERSAQYSISRRKLWRWVFTAILEDTLRPHDLSLDATAQYGGMQGTLAGLIKHELRGWETQHDHDPSRWSWVDNIRFPPADFDRWLKAAMVANRFPVRPKRRPGAKPTKRERVTRFLEHLPEGVSDKETVRRLKRELGIDVSERTVRRAQGRN
jgi:hypothetical protein